MKTAAIFSLFWVLWSLAYPQLPSIIPQPQQVVVSHTPPFVLNPQTVWVSLEQNKNVEMGNAFLQKLFGFSIPTQSQSPSQNYIRLRKKKDVFRLDEYKLIVTNDSVVIEGGEAGLGYGIISLIQMIESKETEGQTEYSLPACTIQDLSRFQWRGMHLDVGRHFFDKIFIKKYLDLMAFYKMNTFHWHLTEDQGWRIEIKKYPKLTEIGAWRNGSMIGHYNEHRFDSLRYGGFYTQDDIREIVQYATDRNITIIPEIEMPGHSQAALAAYPQFSCNAKPLEVGKQWGVYDDVYCTSEEAFLFIENILTEVVTLFPGKYIHIGGDECPKTRWKSCSKCQNRMKKEGLKDENELQSYFIRRVEKFLNAKGKQIIGWDEILEGGLAPNAAVMSWRGTEGGIAAARQHHPVVMTPGSHCYFDHYQGSPQVEPLAIGGNTPIEKVYDYEPVPAELTPDEQSMILGAQGNVWTEYMSTPEQVEYMAFPRMLALSEVLWTEKDKKNPYDFYRRLNRHFPLLEKWNVHAAKSIFEVKYETKPALHGLKVYAQASSWIQNPIIKYALVTDAQPTFEMSQIFPKEGIEITKNTTLAAYCENPYTLQPTLQSYHLNKATGKQVTFQPLPSKYYNHNEKTALTDGILGGMPRVNREWLAWSNQDVVCTVDLGRIQNCSTATIFYLEDLAREIFPPTKIEILGSEDGVTFSPLLAATSPRPTRPNPENMMPTRSFVHHFMPQNIRFLRFQITATHSPSPTKDAWLFIDEISVE